MKALRINGFGSEPHLEDIAVPAPGAGQVLIRIAACGLNFADLLMIKGTYQDTPEPPFTPGLEVAGIVEALGEGVSAPAIGTRVAVFAGRDGLAEFGVFEAARCVAIPDAMPFDEAAAFLVAYGTSHLALTRRARLRAGERLLVLGAAGGVGLTAVELGAAMGAEVIAVARGADKLEAAKAAGAHHLLDAREADLRDEVKALGGADVVYDAVGGELFAQALRATNPEGRILLIGFASGDVPQIPANHLLVKNVDVIGFFWGGYMRFGATALTESLGALTEMYLAGRLRQHVGATRPLAQAAEALDMLRKRSVPGKIVVTMD
ncbi:NADPH:quinone oxidoreductase family protein [Roseibacterium sp. SDUM158017]|uniref:NADPH:quinone oxidoreductase family protein n=1 Tax=Roseicyclus salinarum TaxID=3036773 RepID=UPI002415343E|nr:NADPH:quinone oxidoreductase family protein [Roseibacterium sp. SDUM158017]MDG4649318.1 NADPH:quinone oxidoreductase family protein [Roseibacterium sp. SDUM158017]